MWGGPIFDIIHEYVTTHDEELEADRLTYYALHGGPVCPMNPKCPPRPEKWHAEIKAAIREEKIKAGLPPDQPFGPQREYEMKKTGKELPPDPPLKIEIGGIVFENLSCEKLKDLWIEWHWIQNFKRLNALERKREEYKVKYKDGVPFEELGILLKKHGLL